MIYHNSMNLEMSPVQIYCRKNLTDDWNIWLSNESSALEWILISQRGCSTVYSIRPKKKKGNLGGINLGGIPPSTTNLDTLIGYLFFWRKKYLFILNLIQIVLKKSLQNWWRRVQWYLLIHKKISLNSTRHIEK